MNKTRLDNFETMLADIQTEYNKLCCKVEKLAQQKNVKNVTIKQLLAKKIQYQNILILYKSYGLIKIF